MSKIFKHDEMERLTIAEVLREENEKKKNNKTAANLKIYLQRLK